MNPPLRRRSLLTLLGASAAAWPLAARAQTSRMRRIGALMSLPIDDAQSLPRVTAFVQGLQERGWTVGRNVRIDYRWGASDAESARKGASELVALAPDIILVNSGVNTGIMLQATRTVPIVFVTAVDPVGAGLVASLARPGGNATGFAAFEFSMGAKLLELLKEIAPRVSRIAVLRDPSVPAGSAIFGAIQTAAASSFRVEVIPIDTRDLDELERGVTAFAHTPNGGLILAAPFFATTARSRNLIIALAARHRLPAVYPSSLNNFVTSGGLISYGADATDQYRLAAGYVDRILNGEKPADLPVQAPVKYTVTLNMKTAKALGLEVPASVLVRADEVIE
jgi:putative ABC transport system substrate-binding protein